MKEKPFYIQIKNEFTREWYNLSPREYSSVVEAQEHIQDFRASYMDQHKEDTLRIMQVHWEEVKCK